MKQLQQLINTQFKTLSLSAILVSFSTLLLMIRIKLNHNFFLLFLAWNVFLAIIPYTITMYLSRIKPNTLKLLTGFGIWLVFLPNAPYLLTDLKHLRLANTALFWLDILVLFSFAITGLLLFYFSLIQMEKLVYQTFRTLPMRLFRIMVFFLCSFGMYLGRVLRYNSWEIISQPQQLCKDIFNIITQPKHHYEAWLFTVGFGVFLWFGYWLYKQLTESTM